MKVILVFISVLSGLGVFAQNNNMSVDQAVEYAIKNNKDVKAASLDVASQRELRKTSFDLPKTDVNLLYGQFNSFANDNNISVSQSIPFTVFGSQAKYNRALVAAGEWRKSVTENEVAYAVKRIYYELTLAVERRRLLTEQDSIYEGFMKSASLRYKTGETNLLEQTTAETQRNEIKNQLRRADSEIVNRQMQLKTMVGAEVLSSVSALKLSPIEFSRTSDSSIINSNPSLGYSRQQIDVAEKEKKFEVAKSAPTLLVGFFSQTLINVPKSDGALATSSDRFTGLHLGISIPLWYAPHQSRVKAAEYRRQSQQSNFEQDQANLESQYQQAMQNFVNSRESLEYYTTSALRNADLILKQSQVAFRAGEISYAEFLLGLRNAISIKENYLQTLNDYNQSIIYLQYLSGNK